MDMKLPKCLCDGYHKNFSDVVVGECPFDYDCQCVFCPNFKGNYYSGVNEGFLYDCIDDLICRLLFLIKFQDEMYKSMYDDDCEI